LNFQVLIVPIVWKAKGKAMSHPQSPGPWFVSLHGGHSSQFCEHAEDTLEALIQKAIKSGMGVYGMTEHAPRVEEAYLYAEEREKGYSVERLVAEFTGFAEESRRLQEHYGDQITLLRGFEIETVPPDTYAAVMAQLRHEHAFQYIVGSVHFMGTRTIDYTRERFLAAAAEMGGVEALAVAYYSAVEEMVQTMHPEVTGHIDLVSKYAPSQEAVSTPRVRESVHRALDAVAACGSILDINTAGYRKGLKRPYPAPWIVRAARERDIPVCFGDDAHRVSEVGQGIVEARQYLLEHGYEAITVLEASDQGLVHRAISLHD